MTINANGMDALLRNTAYLTRPTFRVLLVIIGPFMATVGHRIKMEDVFCSMHVLSTLGPVSYLVSCVQAKSIAHVIISSQH